jgi:hypothetical protein
MTDDRADAAVIVFRFADGRAKRLEIEPAVNGFHLEESILTKGGDWHFAGDDELDDVLVENVETLE